MAEKQRANYVVTIQEEKKEQYLAGPDTSHLHPQL